MLCPDCQATAIVKNGHTHYGKQRFKCNDCGRQFVEAATREIVGVYVGDRSFQSALKLWQSLPPLYRQCAVCYTDFWEAYQGVLPSTRHRSVGKESGKTSYIERFNNTLRQRVGREGTENFIVF